MLLGVCLRGDKDPEPLSSDFKTWIRVNIIPPTLHPLEINFIEDYFKKSSKYHHKLFGNLSVNLLNAVSELALLKFTQRTFKKR